MFKKFILIIVSCLMAFNVFGQSEKGCFIGGDMNLTRSSVRTEDKSGFWTNNEPVTDFNICGEFGYMGKFSAIGISLNYGIKDGERFSLAVSVFEELYCHLNDKFYYSPRVEVGYLNLKPNDEFNGVFTNVELCGFVYKITNSFQLRTNILSIYYCHLSNEGVSMTLNSFGINPSVTFRWVF